MLALLRQLSWPELRHQPWRHLAALLAIALGVALAYAVQLINQSALSEFSSAVRAVNGQPDYELRAQRDGFDEALYERVATHRLVSAASPVIEIDTVAWAAEGSRVPLRVLGVDALALGALSPGLMPQLREGADRLALLDPDAAFLNAEAQRRLGTADTLRVQTPQGLRPLAIQGQVTAGGPPLAVMDIAGAQAHFGWLGRLSRIDLRLAPGADASTLWRDLHLPEGVRAVAPAEAAQRVSNLSRAYRVNLTVLALVALFTGAFLVFSILSLSVAQRQPQLALLGVLGLAARERLRWVLAESALLGVVGSALGLALGAALAAAALRLLAGDLGGGYFPGVQPELQLSPGATLIYGTLGVAAALVGGWLPARAAQQLAPAQALKGLSVSGGSQAAAWGPGWLALAAGLAFVPPVAGLPLGAYLSVACLLLGGIACVPAGVGLALRAVRPPRHALALLAVERARHQRHTATIAVAGVVASLSLAVALTVMVASFRDSVTQWLDVVLPADLYLRASGPGGAGDVLALPEALVRAAASVPGVQRVEGQRVTQVQIDPAQPALSLIARPVSDAAQSLPLVGELQPVPPSATPVYVSEAVVSLYGAAPGRQLELPLPNGQRVSTFVAGVWRDYARQHGAVLMRDHDYRRLSGDPRVNELALWLQPGVALGDVQRALRERAEAAGWDAALIDFASPAELRALSLRIFDRSFAVTYWLQAVAIAIGLFGIAASFSAQVLARRKEFGLLQHLGLTRAQVLRVVAAEGAVWTACGALLGLTLGLAVSVVLVKVVNPQSFHWTMDLRVPTGRLTVLTLAVIACGTLAAWVAAQRAASRHLALAVKEDW